MFARLIESTWSMTASRNARSWLTRMKPRFVLRYRASVSRAAMSRWFVGSSISKKLFSRMKRIASSTFVRSPKLSVEYGRYSTPLSTSSKFSSRESRHSSKSGMIASAISSGVSSGFSTSNGKYSNCTEAVMLPLYGYFPRSRFKKVVFPLPLRPIKPHRQSVSMAKEAFSKTLSKLPS